MIVISSKVIGTDIILNNMWKGENMTIDEAIKHAEEVASRMFDDRVHCIKCAEEHRQLAEWLKELKMYREMIPSASEVFLAEIRSDKK